MKKRLIALGSVLLLSLSACSSGPYTTGESLATEVANALEEQIGFRPTIDCGEERIPLEVDKLVRCELTVEGEEMSLGVSVTITDVDGTMFNFDVKVDDA